MSFNKRSWQASNFEETIENNDVYRRMSDQSLQFTDKDRRKIKISPDDGIQAEDANGTVIHDTPDCLIATNMVYGGHIYFKQPATYMNNISVSYTDTNNYRNVYSSITNIDLSSHLPSDLTNARGALLFIYLTVYIANAKTALDASVKTECRFSYTYNTTPNSNNMLIRLLSRCYATDADNAFLQNEIGSHCFCPIVYDNGVPYITLRTWNEFSDMNSNNALYVNSCYIYLHGFLS